MWTIDQIEMNGDFLPGLKLSLPRGLVCIIGPRGNGKSTLAEAVRFAVKGGGGASKQRADLLQANLGSSGLVSVIANTGAEATYTVRRAYKQPAVLLTTDGRAIPNVDLERGTFLPLDAYNSLEIEDIADEALGTKRRALLDDLRGEELSRINLSLAEHRRALEPVAYIFDPGVISRNVAGRDIAVLEVSVMLHQNLSLETLTQVCSALYPWSENPDSSVGNRVVDVTASNTVEFVKTLRKHAEELNEPAIYALMVFDSALIQAGSLAFGSTGNRIQDERSAIYLLFVVARWYRMLRRRESKK